MRRRPCILTSIAGHPFLSLSFTKWLSPSKVNVLTKRKDNPSRAFLNTSDSVRHSNVSHLCISAAFVSGCVRAGRESSKQVTDPNLSTLNLYSIWKCLSESQQTETTSSRPIVQGVGQSRRQEILVLVARFGICYLGHDKCSSLNRDVEHDFFQ